MSRVAAGGDSADAAEDGDRSSSAGRHTLVDEDANRGRQASSVLAARRWGIVLLIALIVKSSPLTLRLKCFLSPHARKVMNCCLILAVPTPW